MPLTCTKYLSTYYCSLAHPRSSLRFDLDSSLSLYHKSPLSFSPLHNALADIWSEMSQSVRRAFNPDVSRKFSHSTFNEYHVPVETSHLSGLLRWSRPDRCSKHVFINLSPGRARGREAGFDRNNKAETS